MGIFHSHILGLLLQSFAMLQQDEFVYTQPNIGPHFHIADSAHPQWPDGYYVDYEESNPLEAPFVNNGLWWESYVLNCGSVAVASSLFDDFDKQHLKGFPIGTADLFLCLVTVSEMKAIHSWAKFGLGPKEVQWTFFKKDF